MLGRISQDVTALLCSNTHTSAGSAAASWCVDRGGTPPYGGLGVLCEGDVSQRRQDLREMRRPLAEGDA